MSNEEIDTRDVPVRPLDRHTNCSTCHPRRLYDMPEAILLEIFERLPTKDLLKVSAICNKFYALINAPLLWKKRIPMKRFPIVPLSEEKMDDLEFWREAVIAQENCQKMWVEEQYNKFTCNAAPGLARIWLSECGRYCYTGNINGGLNMWNLEHKEWRNICRKQGNIWDLIGLNNQSTKLVVASIIQPSSFGSLGYSSSTVKYWDVDHNYCYVTKNLGCAVMGITQIENQPNVVFYSSFNGLIGQIDCRSPNTALDNISTNDHSEPIRCLQPYKDNYLFSGYNDGFVKCFDIRQSRQVLKDVKLPHSVSSMHCKNDHLLVTCFIEGNIYCYDPRTLELSNILQDVHQGSEGWSPELHPRLVTCVAYTNGFVISSSYDGKVKITEPCVDGQCLYTLNDHIGIVRDLSYKNEVLVTAGDNDLRLNVYTAI